MPRQRAVGSRVVGRVKPHRQEHRLADLHGYRKTSAVHFVRFKFSKAAREAVRAGTSVKLGCDHTHYPGHGVIEAPTWASLAGGLGQA